MKNNKVMEKKKEEDYTEQDIKDLLIEKLDGVGNFQQTEFSTRHRPDFVVLGDDYFHYYEIKTAKDSFTRLPSQISNSYGLFTHMTIVTTAIKARKLHKMNVDVGILTITDLEDGNVKPIYRFYEQSHEWKMSIKKVSDILWKNDLVNYLKKFGFKSLQSKNMTQLEELFWERYSDDDCFTILNDILKHRNFDIRNEKERRGGKKQFLFQNK